MNLEGFKEKAGALGVLGVVVTQDERRRQNIFGTRNAAVMFIRHPRALLPAQ